MISKSIKTILLTIVLILLSSSVAISQEKEKVKIIEGMKAPTFYLQDLDGGEIFLSDLVGEPIASYKKRGAEKVVILSFFATWCVPCKAEIPELEKIYLEYSDKNLIVFLIDVEEKKEIVTSFINSLGVNLPILMDKYGKITEKYGIVSIPALFIIDKDGIVRFVSHSFKNVEEFRTDITEILEILFDM